MEWLRRLFSLPERSPGHSNPFYSPTWEDIIDGSNNARSLPHSDKVFSDDNYSDHPFIDPREFDESFSSVFGQMDDMFHQLDAMMRGFHTPGQMMITEIPDDPSSPQRRSPRDFLLKVPDSEGSDGGGGSSGRPPEHVPQDKRSSIFGYSDPHRGGSEDGDDLDNYHRHDGGFTTLDPRSMMDHIFKSFSWGISGSLFGGYQESDGLTDSADDSGQPSADAVRKEDSDLDDRITGGLSQLLKDGPRYWYGATGDSGQGDPSYIQSETVQPQPGVHHSYRSTSIVRIRRPDGSVEETKKYTDSSGREEVVVTHSHPDTSSAHPGQPDGSSGPGHLPSIFSWIFTK